MVVERGLEGRSASSRQRAESRHSLRLRAYLSAIFKADFKILDIGRLTLHCRLLKAGQITLVGKRYKTNDRTSFAQIDTDYHPKEVSNIC